MALTPKQQRFVAEYLVDLNATQAAIRAGYSAKTARVTGPENLSKPAIAAAIQAGTRKDAEKIELSKEAIIAELMKIAFSDMKQFATWGPHGVKLLDSDALGPETACVAEVSETITKSGGSIKFKLHDKVGALRDLGRHLGMWIDKVAPVTPDGQEEYGVSDLDRDAIVRAALTRLGLRVGAARGRRPADGDGPALDPPNGAPGPGRDHPGPMAD